MTEPGVPEGPEAQRIEARIGELARWLLPVITLAIFAGVIFVIHRELATLHLRSVLERLQSIPLSRVLAALAFTAASYWLIGCYDVLGLRYVRRVIRYPRVVFSAFIASAIGHNLGLAALTGGAIRYRLYSSAGLTALDVATVQGFSSLTTGLAIAALAGSSFVFAPHRAAEALHLPVATAWALGFALFAVVAAYALWASFGRNVVEFGGWRLRAPGTPLALTQIALGMLDLSCSAAVLWWLLPADAQVSFLSFAGSYAVAVTAGLISHVPGGLGVFESAMLLMLPAAPVDALLGSLLAYRAVYYLLPLLVAALVFAGKELAGRREHLARAEELAAAYIAPIVPQVAGTMVFVAGVLLLVSGATPSLDARLTELARVLPLPVLELSHLVGSIVGVGLLILARALYRRVREAYRLATWMLLAGMASSILKGLDYEEAVILGVVLAVLWLGRRAFYRPASILEERFTPAWIGSILAVLGAVIWVGLLAQRHVEYSGDLWWTFAFAGDAPRVLRASLAIVLMAAAFLTMNLLRPARPEPATPRAADLECARRAIADSEATLANVALAGDKRLLFSEQGDAFIMYQIAGRSWVALGDPVGPRARHEELVWRFRELSDRHGGWTVFYQVSGERLPLYVDLGLAPSKLGEEARVALDDFTLEGAARKDLRQSHRRAVRDGASFEVVPREQVPQWLPELRRISDAWLAEKSVGEKSFSIGAFTDQYISEFPIALVRSEGEPVAFANAWTTRSRHELSVDLMRFGPDAPRGVMDYLFVELMLWGRAQGYHWFNLGMAPLSGLEHHPLAPVWHRVGNFVFRHGEHFYNFDGLRRYKLKFDPVWEPKYLVSPGGFALPRILVDVSVLIAGGFRELLTR